MSKDTMLRTKQAEIIKDIKRLYGELNSIKGIITSGVVSEEILKADETLHTKIDNLMDICHFIVEFYNSLEPKAISDMKKEILDWRERHAADQGKIFDLKRQIADFRQDSLESKTKIEKADSELEAFKGPEGLVKEMGIFYEIVMHNEGLAKDFFELDDVPDGDALHKKVAYSVKLLEKVLVDGIDFGRKLVHRFEEYTKETGDMTRQVTDEKCRADTLAEELEKRVSALEDMQLNCEKAYGAIEALQKQDEEHRANISELTAEKESLEQELGKEKERSASLSSQVQSEIETREIVENYLERLGFAYETLREVIPEEVMQELDKAIKNKDEGSEELVQELLLGAVVGKEELEIAKNQYQIIQEAFKAIFGDELLEEYEGLTEDQTPYIWLMQKHQELFVDKDKNDELLQQVEKSAKDLESETKEHLALTQGVIHGVSLITQEPDSQKLQENPVGYLHEKIEELKQEKDDYKGKAADLEKQVEAKADVLKRQEEESAGQKATYDGKIKELEAQLQEKENTLTQQRELYEGKVLSLDMQLEEKEKALASQDTEYKGTVSDKEKELAGLREQVEDLQQHIKDSKVKMEKKEISSKAAARKAEMKYLIAKGYIQKDAKDIAIRQLKIAIKLYEQALPGLEQKDDAQNKISEYQTALAKLEE